MNEGVTFDHMLLLARLLVDSVSKSLEDITPAEAAGTVKTLELFLKHAMYNDLWTQDRLHAGRMVIETCRSIADEVQWLDHAMGGYPPPDYAGEAHDGWRPERPAGVTVH